jgi:hypothetical protein
MLPVHAVPLHVLPLHAHLLLLLMLKLAMLLHLLRVTVGLQHARIPCGYAPSATHCCCCTSLHRCPLLLISWCLL